VLGKETKKPMDLTIPMIKVPLQRSCGDGSRGMKSFTSKLKCFWNELKNGRINMLIKHEGTWSLRLENMCC
jgi:hypothetical protein